MTEPKECRNSPTSRSGNLVSISIAFFLCVLGYVYAVIDVVGTKRFYMPIYSIVVGAACIIILVLRMRKMGVGLGILSGFIILAALFNIVECFRFIFQLPAH